jgi:hypothetical protein
VTRTSVTTIGGASTTNTTSSSVGYQYTVQTATHVTVPKGNFTVTPVQQTEVGVLGYTVAYWSADVGNYPKEATYDSNGNEQSHEDLVDYSYTPPAGGGAAVLGIASWLWLLVIGIAAAFVVALILLVRPRRQVPSPVMPIPPPAMPNVPPESATHGPPPTGGPPPPPP